MAQPIILNSNQIRVLRDFGKGYGQGLSFTNVRISSSAGALCDWQTNTDAWERLDAAANMGCLDIEVSREELAAYLDWFDRSEKDQIELRSQFGIYKPRTETQQNLFIYLRLAQAFNYPEDVKRNEE